MSLFLFGFWDIKLKKKIIKIKYHTFLYIFSFFNTFIVVLLNKINNLIIQFFYHSNEGHLYVYQILKKPS